MPSAKNSVLIERCAIDFAFHTGQLLDDLLVDRGIELASKTGASVVTAECVKSCLDQALFDQLLRRVRENSHGEPAGEGGGGGRELEKLLDPSAKRAIGELASAMHAALLVEANRISSGDHIADDDLFLAYQRLGYPDKGSLEFAERAGRHLTSLAREQGV